jgi:hypothetical protein
MGELERPFEIGRSVKLVSVDENQVEGSAALREKLREGFQGRT